MKPRVDFFDTNVMVAASVDHHVHHVAAKSLMTKLVRTGGACSLHSLAEAFTTLTRPSRYGLPATQAITLLRYIHSTFTLVSLAEVEYLDAIEQAANLRVSGPMIYDSLLMACARKIDAKTVYTFNTRHFRRVAPDLADRILEP